MKPEKLLKLIAFNSLATFLLLMIVGESWARLNSKGVHKSSNYWPLIHDSKTGWLFKPGETVSHTNSLDFAVKSKINSLGFLDKEPKIFKNKNSCRVILIGDSFVEAAQVPLREKVQSLLIKDLSLDHTTDNIDVNAFGFSGTGQINQIPFYTEKASKLNPNLIVLVFVNNDFANNSFLLESIRNNWKPDRLSRLFAKVNSQSQLQFLKVYPWGTDNILIPDESRENNKSLNSGHSPIDSIAKYSQFVNWIINSFSKSNNEQYLSLLSSYSERIEKLIIDYPEYNSSVIPLRKFSNKYYKKAVSKTPYNYFLDDGFREVEIPNVYEEAIELTRHSFSFFKEEARQNNSDIVILATYGVDGGYFEKLKGIANQVGIPVLSQREYLNKNKISKSKIYFQHDGHWNARGHELAANQISHYIKRNDICKHSPK